MKNKSSGLSFNFEWNSLVRDVVRSFWAIILVALIALMGIQIVEKSIYTPTYTSSAVLVVRSRVGTTGAFSSLTASVEMANIFKDVFKQNSLKTLAAEELGLDSFDGTISTSLTESTNLLKVSVRAEEPELAFKLLTAILKVYPEVTEAVFTDSIIDIVSDPQMPTSPSNSRLMVYRKQIILLAMLAEGGMIVLLSLLRGTIKEERGFTDKVDSKLIATISHERAHVSKKERIKKKKRAMLVNDAYSSLRFTEDYQKLCTKFEHMNKLQGKKSFIISSVAENEGKSTVAANVALGLSERGYNVVLLDLDVRKPSMYKIFDFHESIESAFSDVLSQKVKLSDFKFYRYRKSSLAIAFNKKTAGNSELLMNSMVVGAVLKELEEKTDFIIVDTAPISVSADAVTISEVADATILVVRTDCVPVEDINETILNITESGANFEGCILNDVYKPFTLFGQMGTDERGYYYGQNNYYGYSKNSKTFTNESNETDDSFSADSLDSLNSNE